MVGPRLEAFQDSYGRFGYRYVDEDGKPITNTPASPIANPVDPTQNTADKQSANSEAGPAAESPSPTAAAPKPATPTPGLVDRPTDNGSASGADMAPEEAQTIGDFLGSLGTVASFGLAALGGPIGMATTALGLGLSVANNTRSSVFGAAKEALGFGKNAKGDIVDVGKGFQSPLGGTPLDQATPSFDTKSFDTPTMTGYTPDLGSIPDVATMESQTIGSFDVQNLDAQNTLSPENNVTSSFNPDPSDPTEGAGPGGVSGTNENDGGPGSGPSGMYASGGLVQRKDNMTMGSGGLASPGALNMSGGGLVNQPGATRPYHLMDGLQRMATGGLAAPPGAPPMPVPAPAPEEDADVSDEVPAKLTDGEFVFDVDTVRFYGLDKLLKMQQKAQEAMSAQRGEPMVKETPQEAMLPPSAEGVASPPMQMAEGGEVKKRTPESEADFILDSYNRHKEALKKSAPYSSATRTPDQEQALFDAAVRGYLDADNHIRKSREDAAKNYAEGGLVDKREVERARENYTKR